MKMMRFCQVVMVFLGVTVALSAQETGKQWSKEKAMEWQQENPWYVGFNYIPAYAN